MRRRPKPKLRWAIWILLFGFIACSDGSGGCSTGCDGMAVVPYPADPPPGGDLQADVVRARLTQSTLDFLAYNIEPLLAQFMVVEGREARFVFPDGLTPPTSPIQVGSGSYIAFDLDNLQEGLTLEWLDEDGLGRPGIRFRIRRAELYLDVGFSTNIELFPDASCRIQSNEGIAALTVAELRFDLRLSVDEAGPAPRLTAVTENVYIQLAEATEEIVLAMTVTPCDGTSTDPSYFCDDPICSQPDAACADICGLVDLFAQLGGFLIQIIQPVLDDFAPTIAGFLSDALIEALGAIPLGIETQLDMSGLLGPIFRNAQPLALKVAASNDLSVAGQELGRGLDLGLSGGVATLSTAFCATDAIPPDLPSMHGPPPEFSGWIEVDNPHGEGTNIERYHLAMTISQALLNQATWNAFQSGLFCFNLDAEDIEGLAGGVFSFTAGLLQTFDNRLVGIADAKAPMLASVSVSEPPTIRLGAGHLVAPEEEDPLLEIAVNNLELGLFMMIDGSQLRVSGLKADLVLLISIVRTPTGSLELVVEDIQLVDIRQVYNEMVPASDLSDLFELVVDIVVDAFLGDSMRIEIDLSDTLSSALGFPLEMRINTIRRDYGPTDVPYLSLYATLCDEDDMANELNPTCFVPPPGWGTAAASHFVRLYDAESLYVEPDGVRFSPPRFWGAPSGEALLAIDSDPPGRYELQARVDGGAWSGFDEPQDGLYGLRSPRLKTLGLHTLEVRVREVGFPATRGEAIPIEVWVDRELPVVTATQVGEAIWIEAHDLGSGEAIELWWRYVDGPAVSEWEPTGTVIDVTEISGTVEIIGRDQAGNVSQPATVWLGAADLPDSAPEDGLPAGAGGCGAAPSALAAWVVLLLVRRRRR